MNAAPGLCGDWRTNSWWNDKGGERLAEYEDNGGQITGKTDQ